MPLSLCEEELDTQWFAVRLALTGLDEAEATAHLQYIERGLRPFDFVVAPSAAWDAAAGHVVVAAEVEEDVAADDASLLQVSYGN